MAHNRLARQSTGFVLTVKDKRRTRIPDAVETDQKSVISDSLLAHEVLRAKVGDCLKCSGSQVRLSAARDDAFGCNSPNKTSYREIERGC